MNQQNILALVLKAEMRVTMEKVIKRATVFLMPRCQSGHPRSRHCG
jgi:hypothetical protein